MSKHSYALLTTFILLSTTLCHATNQIHHDVGSQTNLTFIEELRQYKETSPEKDTLAQEINLAELKELYEKINEDLDSRLDYLDCLSKRDQEKVIQLLLDHKALIEEKISKLETKLPVHFRESPVNTYQRILTIGSVSVLSLAIILILYKASYDEKKGLQVPSIKRFQENS